MSNPPFWLGINYWPARTAMGFWRSFRASEVAEDFARIAAAGCDCVRIFLTWEDFQPAPSRVDSNMVANLVATLELAAAAGLSVMPTLFTGHMSGVNWMPPWALGGDAGDARFRVISGGRVASSRLANWYSDPAITEAQCLLASELARALSGHRALWAWDLGNENSNCVIPPSKASARGWLLRLTDAIRAADARATITLGLHMEDLAEDRNLGPHEAAEACDFLTMHGYPGYAAWTDGATDERLLPFLTRLTSWLGGGADVVFSEFGVPTFRAGDEGAVSASSSALVDEHAAALYVTRALGSLRAAGAHGALLWCYADYAEAIWQKPPLDLASHERSFGLWRADGSPKPAAHALAAFAKQHEPALPRPEVTDAAWLDIDASDFYAACATELPRLYRRYCAAARDLPE